MEPAAPSPVQTPTSMPSNGTTPATPRSGVLSSGVSIKGSVKFGSELVIDGYVEGSITSGGRLTIGEHAEIKGEIRTKIITVHGTVEGDIIAEERCELRSGCTLKGDIEAPRLVVDEEATFLGSAKISSPKKAPTGAAPAAEQSAA
ncbi:MAG TPA: polymer-forming cytoskeletal protein [Chthoniobacterales bacterium]|nr:polymer-forming cytoskeletal protein [Chthoniobacterales bacterium]